MREHDLRVKKKKSRFVPHTTIADKT